MVALGLTFAGVAAGLTMMCRVNSTRQRVAGATIIVLGVIGAMWWHPARAGLTRERAHTAEFCALQGREYLWWVDLRRTLGEGTITTDWRQDLAGLTFSLESIGAFCMQEVESCIRPQGKLRFARLGTKLEDLRGDLETIGRALTNRTSCAAESR